eukprot:SAG11_NODE_12840_length_683_cov_0.606164_2_plen_103_part_00
MRTPNLIDCNALLRNDALSLSLRLFAVRRLATTVCSCSAKPVLSMSEEFDRDFEWEDWESATHSLRAEWQYATGTAVRDNLTGRDLSNHGKTLQDFRSQANS